MPAPQQDKSALLAALEWLDEPFQVVGNSLQGRGRAAGRHALDFLADPLDAAIPGDLIPKFATPEDETSGSELFGIDRDKHPIGATATDILAGAALNPLSYLSFGAGQGVKLAGKTIAGAGKTLDPLTLIGKGLNKAGGALDKATGSTKFRDIKQGVKSTLGYLRPGEKEGKALMAGRVAQGNITKAGNDYIVKALEGVPENVRIDAGKIINNVSTHQGPQSILPPSGRWNQAGKSASQRFITIEEQLDLLADRVNSMPWEAAHKAQVLDTATKAIKLSRAQWAESIKDVPIFGGQSMYKNQLGKLVPFEDLVDDYVGKMKLSDRNVAATAGAMDASRAKIAKVQDELKTLYKYRKDGAVAGRLEKLAEREQQLVDAHDELEKFTKGIGEMPGFQQYLKQSGHDLTDINPEILAPPDYMHREFNGMPEADAMRGRSIGTGADLAGFMNTNNVAPEFDVAKSFVKRAGLQGDLAGRAAFGKILAGDDFKFLADPKSREAVDAVINNLKDLDPDSYELAKNFWSGMKPRGPVMGFLAGLNNKIFKPAVTFGLVFPRVSGHMRNILAFPTQLVAEEGVGLAQAGKQVLRAPQTVWYAMRQGIEKAFGTKLASDEGAKSIDLIEKAFAQSGGRAANVVTFLKANNRPDLVAAIEHGVVDSGFIKQEQVLDSILKTSWGRKAMSSIGMGEKAQAKAFDIVDAPAAAWQGAEQYARLVNFLDLAKTKPVEVAAQQVRDALYDYNIQSAKNRTLRDIIPFAAFATNSVRQQANFISRVPAAGTALAGLYHQDDDAPVYPYLAHQARIPLGKDQQGNPQYMAGFGLPFESLNLIPNLTGSSSASALGRDIERGVIASGHPLLKSIYAATAGHDPYFETPYGSYDKIPAIGKAGAVGQAYNNIAGTGVIAPLDATLRTIDKFTDPRRTLGTSILDTFTGANVVSVDPERAKQQQIQQLLTRNPDIGKFETLYATTDDPDLKELLQELNATKHALKQKKKAADAAVAKAPAARQLDAGNAF